MPTLTTYTEHTTRNPRQRNWARKIKGIQIRKEDVLSLYRQCDLVCIELKISYEKAI